VREKQNGGRGVSEENEEGEDERSREMGGGGEGRRRNVEGRGGGAREERCIRTRSESPASVMDITPTLKSLPAAVPRVTLVPSYLEKEKERRSKSARVLHHSSVRRRQFILPRPRAIALVIQTTPRK